MASIPPLKRLVMDDFKSQQAWISPLLLQLNEFEEAVVNGLSRSLTLKQNMAADIKTVTLSSVPTATLPLYSAWNLKFRPISIHVGNIQLQSGAAFTLSSAVQIQWQFNGTSLLITNVVGIIPTGTNPYILTLVCFTG